MERRTALKVWTTPIVSGLLLPAHAQTSPCYDSDWNFNIQLQSRIDPFLSLDAVDLEPPELISRTLTVTTSEVTDGLLVRNIDFDGSGPAADFIFVRYSITDRSCEMLAGTYTDASVDTGIEQFGVWTATPS